jgi:ABC-type Na+ efflux pump permease subunit
MMTSAPVPPPLLPDEQAQRLLPGDLHTASLIARRAALESLRDRTTLLMSAIFSLALPILWVLLAIRPAASGGLTSGLGAVIAIYLLTVGLLPATASASVAAGQFAGEKEQGNLAPLLASPASNRAIFAGKVMGAVLPAVLYAVIAEISYLVEIAVVVNPRALRLIPAPFALAMLALVPAVAIFGAVVASLISSRVRTFQAAQNLASLVLLPILFAFFALAAKMQDWGALGLIGGVDAVVAADVVLLMVAAATWRREEVLASR